MSASSAACRRSHRGTACPGGLQDLAFHASLAGAGERAGRVTEQLAFDERLGNGGAVQGHEGARRSIACSVQCACKHFLAGAGRTLEITDRHARGWMRRALLILRAICGSSPARSSSESVALRVTAAESCGISRDGGGMVSARVAVES